MMENILNFGSLLKWRHLIPIPELAERGSRAGTLKRIAEKNMWEPLRKFTFYSGLPLIDFKNPKKLRVIQGGPE